MQLCYTFYLCNFSIKCSHCKRTGSDLLRQQKTAEVVFKVMFSANIAVILYIVTSTVTKPFHQTLVITENLKALMKLMSHIIAISIIATFAGQKHNLFSFPSLLSHFVS